MINSRGYITLVAVIIVGAVGVSVSLSLLWLGAGTSRSSLARQQSDQAKALANTCAEEALRQIRDSTPYSGTGNLTLGQGTCTYTVTVGSGEARTITASGTVGTIKRKISISLTAINPQIVVSSWQEVAD